MKQVCPGEISYKWIEESIRNGELQDPEKYRIAAPAGGGSGARTARRTEFSPRDDQILLEAVRKATEMGLGLSGNKLYDDIASRVSLPSQFILTSPICGRTCLLLIACPIHPQTPSSLLLTDSILIIPLRARETDGSKSSQPARKTNPSSRPHHRKVLVLEK